MKKKDLIAMIPFIASISEANLMPGDEVEEKGFITTKQPLTKKQIKARGKSKRAKKARKIQRRKK
jgi:hypothetical protein